MEPDPTSPAPPTRAAGARARARAELTAEIVAAARRQLAEVGAAGLSLRAVAREVGMVSSAVYRYFPSRDDLLTRLIIDTYDTLGDVAEQAAHRARRAGPAARWMAVCAAVRDWARAHPQEYALVYGSPVPGYAAPEATIAAAARLPLVFFDIVRQAHDEGEDTIVRAASYEELTPALRADFEALRRSVELDVPDLVLARLVTAYTLLVGTISFELFGHLRNVVNDEDGWFEHQMRVAAARAGVVR